VDDLSTSNRPLAKVDAMSKARVRLNVDSQTKDKFKLNLFAKLQKKHKKDVAENKIKQRTPKFANTINPAKYRTIFSNRSNTQDFRFNSTLHSLGK
jgi:hypothetical protein